MKTSVEEASQSYIDDNSNQPCGHPLRKFIRSRYIPVDVECTNGWDLMMYSIWNYKAYVEIDCKLLWFNEVDITDHCECNLP